MRMPLVAGNWKMNMTRATGQALVAELSGLPAAVEVVVCPPFTLLAEIAAHCPAGVSTGGQDCFWVPNGAFTGQISAEMLDDAGARYGIVGHSETRGRFGKLDIDAGDVGYFAETNTTVRRKMEALMRVGLVPILCVGETLAEREAGRTEDVIREQLEGAFQGFTEGDMAKTVVAYEPVWAIGTGQTCAADEANRVCAFIRRWFPAGVQAQVRILYGGSVKAENAAELFGQSDIDGGLVGGASLDAAGFRRIVEAAAP